MIDKEKHILHTINRMHNWLISKVLKYDKKTNAFILNDWYAKGGDYGKNRVLKIYNRIAELQKELETF